MTGIHVALIRGINVGRAKRVAMSDLRALVAGLGFTGVRTVLNSGNVIFTVTGKPRTGAAGLIEEGLAGKLGVSARVIVLSAGEFLTIVDENPLLGTAGEAARLLVAFFSSAADRTRLRELMQQDWTPETLAIGSRAAYLWCPEGILDSPVLESVGRALGGEMTTRNWATVMRLRALLDGP